MLGLLCRYHQARHHQRARRRQLSQRLLDSLSGSLSRNGYDVAVLLRNMLSRNVEASRINKRETEVAALVVHGLANHYGVIQRRCAETPKLRINNFCRRLARHRHCSFRRDQTNQNRERDEDRQRTGNG